MRLREECKSAQVRFEFLNHELGFLQHQFDAEPLLLTLTFKAYRVIVIFHLSKGVAPIRGVWEEADCSKVGHGSNEKRAASATAQDVALDG